MSESNENSKKDNKYLIHRQKCKRNSNENIRIENELDKDKKKEIRKCKENVSKINKKKAKMNL